MRTPIKIPSSQRPSGQKQRLFARATGAGFNVHAAGNATVIEFFDEVGSAGISEKAFSEKLKAAPGDIILKINSPGGDVFEGIGFTTIWLPIPATFASRSPALRRQLLA